MKNNILTLCIIHTSFFTSFAQVCLPDNSFSFDGKVTTAVGSGGDYAFSAALQADNKIVVAGYCTNSSEDFTLIRYNSDGTLDTSFDFDGIVSTDFGSNGDDEGKSVAIQSDGKIVVAGISSNGFHWGFALIRYNSDGSPDNNFGTGGKVTTLIGNSDAFAQSVVLQNDGKIVVAGYISDGSLYNFALVRYNSNGSLDSSFGLDGKITTDFGNNGDLAFSSVIQSDGKILVAGYTIIGAKYDLALARYTPDGSLDNTFSSDGKITTAIGSATDRGYSVAVQRDGKIVVAGKSFNGSDDNFVLVRYNTDGTLDNTFDSDGKVSTAIGSTSDDGNSVAIQDDGKIVVAGAATINGTDKNFTLVRYNTDGTLDNTFDAEGKVTMAIGDTDSRANSVVIQRDGKIVVAGVNWNGADYDVAIARFNNTLTGINNVAISNSQWKVEISPNPTNGKIQLISNLNSEMGVKIYNLLGDKVYSSTINSAQGIVNISTQPKGIYFIEVVLENSASQSSGSIERRSKKIILE